MEPIKIAIGRQSDGCSYQLDPLSRQRIQSMFPGVRVAPRVFVGYETRSEFEAIHGPMWGQIARLLTGVSVEKLNEIGGFLIYEPATKRTWAGEPAAKETERVA